MTYQANAIDLIEIDTDYFNLSIKGKPVHPDIDQLYSERDTDNIKALLEADNYDCNLNTFLYYDPRDGLIVAEIKSIKSYPFFYEQQDYQVLIEAKGDYDLEFYHENKNIRRAVSKLSRKNNILMGSINFRNDVGFSELEIRAKNKTIFLLKIEVFPSKIDYRNDYYELLHEVNREVYNLTYDFLRSTFQGMKLKEAENISHIEFFSIFETIFNDFIKAYHRIEKYPHHRLNKTRKVLPSSRVKRVDKKSIKWLRKNMRYYDQEIKLPVKLLNINKKTSFDTFENRFVKWIINELLKKLINFEKRYKMIFKNNVEEDVLKIIEMMSEKIEYILKHSFLNNIGDIYKIDSLSLVLQMAPGYREVYKYYLMLIKGLSINGQIFRLSMKQIWELYEYWCFLELNRLLRNKYNMVKHNLIDINYSGVYVTLNKSSSSYVEYENKKTKERFQLSYNNSEGEGITTGQKPDNVLSLKKEGSNTEYKFIFDAKYRINPALPGTTYYKNHKGLPGPEEDTINTMHRYRDAIVYNEDYGYKRRMVGAFVLFPYKNEEEFKEHTFYKSIEKVNVGAFPFLPGNTKLLADFLENLIEESAVNNFERNVLPSGVKEYKDRLDFKQNVLVGSLSKPRQLDISLKKYFYHIPADRIKKEVKDLEYVAVYQSSNLFADEKGVRYYGKIIDIEIKKRKDIEVPFDLKKRDKNKPYYVFHLDEWKLLETPILPDGYGVRGSHIYTNFMLLNKASTISELSIKTLKEWRLWIELNRLKDRIKVLVHGNKIDQNSRPGGFSYKNIEVIVLEDRIIIKKDDEIALKIKFYDFIYNLRGVIKKILQ